MRTQEQLAEYFNAFKLKKQKQKEKESQRKKEKRLDEYKAIDKAIQQEKKATANKIIQWHQQWLQTVLKQPIQQFYETDVGDFNEDNLYTFEELMNIETLYPNETGRINWSFYNYLVNKTKQLCQSTQNKQRKKNTGNSITKQ